MAHFSIKDLSEFSGLKQHTIRVWEQRYTFLRPRRARSTHRSYSPEDLNTLLDAALLNQNGYKVSLIDKMSLEKKSQIFERISDQQKKLVHELIISMAKMNIGAFEATLNQSVLYWGIHTTIHHVLIPFCEKTGLLQPAYNKNYIENILLVRESIKRKLITGIENAQPAENRNKTALLFLAAGQVQDLPLLYLQYMMQQEGFTTLNLGHLNTTQYLEMLCKKTRPDYVISQVAKGSSLRCCASLLQKLPALSAHTRFLTIGNVSLPPGEGMAQYDYAETPSGAIDLLLQQEEGYA